MAVARCNRDVTGKGRRVVAVGNMAAGLSDFVFVAVGNIIIACPSSPSFHAPTVKKTDS